MARIHSPFGLSWDLVIARSTCRRRSLVETRATSCTSILVNLVELQGLMRTPQDCKVMWVAACKFFAIWSYIRGWQCHRIVYMKCHKLLPSSEFGKFYMELPILFAISSQRLSCCNVNQNSCRPTTAYLRLSWVDLLAHFLLLIDCDYVHKNKLT